MTSKYLNLEEIILRTSSVIKYLSSGVYRLSFPIQISANLHFAQTPEQHGAQR
jgi:hypothetical protein